MGFLSGVFDGVISCYYCHREFGSLQGLRAHLKHCQGRGFNKRRGGLF